MLLQIQRSWLHGIHVLPGLLGEVNGRPGFPTGDHVPPYIKLKEQVLKLNVLDGSTTTTTTTTATAETKGEDNLKLLAAFREFSSCNFWTNHDNRRE